MLNLQCVKHKMKNENRVMEVSMSSQAVTKADGLAKMRKVSHSNSMMFSIPVLSHASVTLNFKYSKPLQHTID